MYLALGVGSIVINMFLCVFCTVYYKRKRQSNNFISNAAIHSIEDANIQEHPYDEIDENAVMGEITNQGIAINQQDKDEISTASGASGEDVQEQDYLTPYQPIVNFPNAMYKNLPLNFVNSRTSDFLDETYENTVIFN